MIRVARLDRLQNEGIPGRMPVTSCQPSIFNLLQGGIPMNSKEYYHLWHEFISIPHGVLQLKISPSAKILFGILWNILQYENQIIELWLGSKSGLFNFPTSRKFLAKKMDCSKQGITQMLKILKNNGLIQFEEYPPHPDTGKKPRRIILTIPEMEENND